jgi:hypothetical protein
MYFLEEKFALQVSHLFTISSSGVVSIFIEFSEMLKLTTV